MATDPSPHLAAALSLLPPKLQHPAVSAVLQLAIAEDLDAEANYLHIWEAPAQGDITSQATLPADSILHGRITAKAAGVIAGLPVARAVFFLVDPTIQFVALVQDGTFTTPGTLLCTVDGPGRSLLAAERSALNFLGRMSGTATLAHKFAEAIAGTHTVVLDTRKTAPGLRHLDKYAVRMGGCANHRAGLYDMILIKDNHIDGAGGIRQAVTAALQRFGNRYPIEVEVKDLDELQTALSLPIQRIMLDNMDLETMRQAVEITNRRIPLEASGNVRLDTVRQIADTGVDFISAGALTHSAPVLDISMRLRYT